MHVPPAIISLQKGNSQSSPGNDDPCKWDLQESLQAANETVEGEGSCGEAGTWPKLDPVVSRPCWLDLKKVPVPAELFPGMNKRQAVIAGTVAFLSSVSEISAF